MNRLQNAYSFLSRNIPSCVRYSASKLVNILLWKHSVTITSPQPIHGESQTATHQHTKKPRMAQTLADRRVRQPAAESIETKQTIKKQTIKKRTMPRKFSIRIMEQNEKSQRSRERKQNQGRYRQDSRRKCAAEIHPLGYMPFPEQQVPAVAEQHALCRTDHHDLLPGKRLTAPVIIEPHSNTMVADLASLPFDEIIAPKSDSPFTLEELDLARENMPIHQNEWDYDPEMCGLRNGCRDIRTALPTLMQLGVSLEQNLKPDTCQALLAKHRDCPTEVYHDSRYCPRNDCAYYLSSGLNEAINRQQTLSAPLMESWMKNPVPHKGGIIRKTLVDALRHAGFSNAEPAVCIGPVHRKIANPVATTRLFTTDACTSPIMRGKFTYLIQILALAQQGKITPECLAHLGKKENFTEYFEISSPTYGGQSRMTGKDGHSLVMHGVQDCLTMHSPASLQRLFLGKMLSQAVENIIACENIDRKIMFLSAFGMPTSNPTQSLQKLHRSLCLLEACMLDSLIKGQKKAGKKSLQLNTKEASHYPVGSSCPTQVKLRTLHYMKKRRRAEGIVFMPALSIFPETQPNLYDLAESNSKKSFFRSRQEICGGPSVYGVIAYKRKT